MKFPIVIAIVVTVFMWYWHNNEARNARSLFFFFIDQIAIEWNGCLTIWNVNWKSDKMPMDNWNDCADIYTNLHTYMREWETLKYRHIWWIGKQEWTLNKQQMIWTDGWMDEWIDWSNDRSIEESSIKFIINQVQSGLKEGKEEEEKNNTIDWKSSS